MSERERKSTKITLMDSDGEFWTDVYYDEDLVPFLETHNRGRTFENVEVFL